MLSSLNLNYMSKEKRNMLKKSKLRISQDDILREIDNFISNQINDLQEEGNMCLYECEEEGSYHMVSYWIEGTYLEIENFLNKMYDEGKYSDKFLKVLKLKYPNNLDTLIKKCEKIRGYVNNNLIAIEILATILLKEMEYYPQWYCVFGSDKEDFIDYMSYEITNAINNPEEFPVIQSEDLVAAMYGINNTVHPSDLYDVFAYNADTLKFKDENNSLIDTLEIQEKEYIFTPDLFLTAGVIARWKNYKELFTTKNGEYNLKYYELELCYKEIVKTLLIKDNEKKFIKNNLLMKSIIDDYFNRFSQPPNSLPLHRNMMNYKILDNEVIISYKIRGIENKKNCWKDIYSKKYIIPKDAEEYQNLLLEIASDFKKELVGMEKEKGNNADGPYYGKYPNKDSATHGLTFLKDINVSIKNKRGFSEKKKPKANYSLLLAEKQATYVIKKILWYSKKNPVVSSSFGIDSTVLMHLVRKVTKNFKILNSDSLVEYPELVSFKRYLINEWNLEDKIYVTKPKMTYWQVQEKWGWNLERKGYRGKGPSVSEICCNMIKHKPTFELIDKFIEEKNPIEVNFSGIRADESLSREKSIKRDNLVYYAKSWKSIRTNPIAFFTNDMIWEYVKKYDVPYCEVYNQKVYYEDVFDNVSSEEIGKVFYQARIGCWCCVVSRGALLHLKKYHPQKYNFLMIKKGLAKELFKIGAQKIGIIADFDLINQKKDKNMVKNQISLFDSIESNKENELTAEEILERYPIEQMEYMITKRPCKFLLK